MWIRTFVVYWSNPLNLQLGWHRLSRRLLLLFWDKIGPTIEPWGTPYFLSVSQPFNQNYGPFAVTKFKSWPVFAVSTSFALFPWAIIAPEASCVHVGPCCIFQMFHDTQLLNTHAAHAKTKNAHRDTHTQKARSHKSFKAQVFSEKSFG